MTAAEKPADLYRVPDHSRDPVDDWLAGSTDVLDGLIVDEHITFTPAPAHPQRYLPPIGWVPVDDNIGTPVFDSVNADCQPGRTPTGRISKKPPRLPYTGGVAYQVYVDGSRDDHSSYHGGRR
jgi:hypothetical protein